MTDALWASSLPLSHFVVRAAVVYAVVLVLLRLGGKRQVGQMAASDLVVLLLISNAVQNSMNGGDNSITGGVILAATLIALGWVIEFLTYRSKRLENLIEGTPRLLIHHGRVIDENLRRERVNPRQLRTQLRSLGVHSFDELQEAVLESNGTLSIIRKSELIARAPEARP